MSSLLDTYFILARHLLNVRIVPSWNASFQWLVLAADILRISLDSSRQDQPCKSEDEIDTPAFALALYATFHNLASTLYNAGEYAGAVKFLNGGCMVGAVALTLRPPAIDDPSDKLGYQHLATQLWKRWELLGVCLGKIGDRRVSLPTLLTYPL